MGKRWVTADLHFGHDNIIPYARRPFKDTSQMDRALVRRYNEVVEPDDEVFFIGDLTIKGPERIDWIRQIVQKMNGTKHLIFGNHDNFKWHQYMDIGFTSVHSFLELDAVQTVPHFESVGGGLAGKMEVPLHQNIKVRMCHDPAWAQDPNYIWICGHTHNCYFTAPTHIAIVSVELTEYRPVLLNKIIDGFRPGNGAVRTEPRPNRTPKDWLNGSTRGGAA